MLELALNYDQALLTVRSIASRQSISEKYIEQIIGLLNKAGLVRSQRGAAGGYRLANNPNEITVGQILRVTEGDMQIVECTNKNAAACERINECATYNVWVQIKEAVDNVVDHITLGDLVEDYRIKCSGSIEKEKNISAG